MVFWGVILNLIQFLEGVEGRSWRGTLELGVCVIMWTRC